MPMDQAHFHCQYKKFSRAKAQSAVAAAAYRLGHRIHDERTGFTYDYTKRRGITDHLTVTPTGKKVPDWIFEPGKLWNAAEAAEKTNPRALVMHEWEIALPYSLDARQRKEAARDMAQFIADRYGCIAQAAFHNPSREGDQRNFHIHLMFTTRAIEEKGFAKSKYRHFSRLEKEARDNGHMTGGEEIVFIRQQWERIGNEALERAGQEPTLDHRSYEDQGLEIEPEKHLGPDATAKERRGELTAKGDFNRAVRERNQKRLERMKAWQECKSDITGTPLPAPLKKIFAKEAEKEKPQSLKKEFSQHAAPEKIESAPDQNAFLNLVAAQKQERALLLEAQLKERKKLAQQEREARNAQKREWAKLYRKQRQERQALFAKFGSWKARILLRLDFTGKLSKGHQKALQAQERAHRIQKAKLSRSHHSRLKDLRTYIQTKQVKEKFQVDFHHITQRQKYIIREFQRQAGRERNRGDRGQEKDLSRDR